MRTGTGNTPRGRAGDRPRYGYSPKQAQKVVLPRPFRPINPSFQLVSIWKVTCSNTLSGLPSYPNVRSFTCIKANAIASTHKNKPQESHLSCGPFLRGSTEAVLPLCFTGSGLLRAPRCAGAKAPDGQRGLQNVSLSCRASQTRGTSRSPWKCRFLSNTQQEKCARFQLPSYEIAVTIAHVRQRVKGFQEKGPVRGGLAGRARPGWPLIKKRTAGPTPTCMGPAVLYRRIRRRFKTLFTPQITKLV